MAPATGRSAAKRVGGAALMLLGAALIGYGSHYIALYGNCSSTGYLADIGPVHKCGGTEAISIVSLFFLGPALALVGWALARIWGVLWPAVCVSVGAGLFTNHLDSSAPSGARTFGFVAGICFFALAVVSVLFSLRKLSRSRRAAPAGLAGASAMPVMPAPPPGVFSPLADLPAPRAAPAASGPAADPLERIAKLAQLRDSGALTEEEFAREKAKLLAQM
jgi:hypothetical protein